MSHQILENFTNFVNMLEHGWGYLQINSKHQNSIIVNVLYWLPITQNSTIPYMSMTYIFGKLIENVYFLDCETLYKEKKRYWKMEIFWQKMCFRI